MVTAPVANVLPAGFISTIQVEPVGRWFLSHWDRIHSARGLSTTVESSSESEEDVSEGDTEFEDDLVYLRSLDPKECKDQDHYRVLGIKDLRIDATDDQIKKAYRFKVLKHHPDKRRAAGEEIRQDDDYFTCITKAFETLGNPSKRRAYDSVDPTFDDDVPDAIKKSSNQDFYKTFAPVFERNARWATRGSMPKLGDENASRSYVDKFYKFWYEFESWREYSYLDEEDKEKGSDRDERRWIEKNNRLQRAERKKEEMKRIRRLVDNAYNSDPRISKFKEEDKQEKLAKKKAKQDAARAKKEEEDRIRREAEEAEKKERERIEAEEKLKQEAEKKEREANKKALKKEKKALRTVCKDKDFFATNDDERVSHMTELDKLCEILNVEELGQLNRRLQEAKGEASRSVFIDAFKSLNAKLEEENFKTIEKSSKGSGADKSSSAGSEWSKDELALLIKAVNLFPAGTNQRWEVVANFINQHTATPEMQRNAKETLNKAKELQQGDFHLSTLKEEANKKAYENLERNKKREVKVDDTEGTRRTETAAEVQGLNMNPWTPDEQKLLEQALKSYPSSLGSERWDRIASCLPNRSKKDCMKRYKELAEMIRAKKAAQAAVAKK